jgi:hypothetical protein
LKLGRKVVIELITGSNRIAPDFTAGILQYPKALPLEGSASSSVRVEGSFAAMVLVAITLDDKLKARMLRNPTQHIGSGSPAIRQ